MSDIYNMNLERRDVFIYRYPAECKKCKMVKNIVYDVRGVKKWRLLFKELRVRALK